MKKNVKKILFLILLFFVILFCNTIVNAASFSASASKTTLTKGSTATLTITASDCAGKFSITSSDSNVVSISSSSEWVESGSKSITITAKKEGTAKITVKAADVSDSSANVVSGSKSISITVKDTTSNNNSNSNSNNNSGNNGNNNNNPTPSEPTFTSTNETVYAKSKANIRSSYSTSSTKVGSLSEGDSVTRIGIGNNGWSKITYNGQTAYISTSLLTKTKPEENNSKPNETTDNTTNNSEKNNDKPEETILQLDELKIENYKLTPEFSKDIYEYKIDIDENIEKLNIEPISNDKDITIEVKGNENLKIGDNLITITLKKDGVEEKTYNITVTKKENVKEETVTKINQDLLNQEIEQINKNLKIRQWTIRGIIIFVTILIIIIIILRYITVRNETEEYFNNDYINIRDKFNELNNNIDNKKEDIKINNNVENEDEKDIDEVKQSKIQNQNQNEDAETQIQEDDDVKPKRNKRSKGKHF